MTRRRLAGTGAAYSFVVSMLSVGAFALSSADTAWALSLLFLPLWPGLMLLAAARGVRLTRGFAAAALATTLALYVTVEVAFGGFQWAFALTLLSVAVLALGAAALKIREQAPAASVLVHS